MSDFITFHINAVSNFTYFIITNFWLLLLGISTAGIVILRLKEEIDTSVREEQNII